MVTSNCEICNSKNPSHIKQQEAIGLLSNLGIKILLSKNHLLMFLCFSGINTLIKSKKEIKT